MESTGQHVREGQRRKRRKCKMSKASVVPCDIQGLNPYSFMLGLCPYIKPILEANEHTLSHPTHTHQSLCLFGLCADLPTCEDFFSNNSCLHSTLGMGDTVSAAPTCILSDQTLNCQEEPKLRSRVGHRSNLNDSGYFQRQGEKVYVD